MRYKGQFKGSYLFCRSTKQYYPFQSVLKQLDQHSVCLVEDPEEAEALRTAANQKSSEALSQMALMYIDSEDSAYILKRNTISEVEAIISNYEHYMPSETNTILVIH